MNLPPKEEAREMMAQFDATRKNAWEKYKAETIAALDKQGFPNDPQLREFYIYSIERLWLRGYADGCHDSAVLFAKEMGFGHVIETVEKMVKVVASNPTNN